MQHDAARSDLGTSANLDVAEDAGPGSDHDPLAYLGMSVADMFAGSAESYTVQHRYAITDHRRLTDHDAGSMIDHHAAANGCGGVDIDAKRHRHAVLQMKRQRAAALTEQRVRYAVALKRMVPLEKEQRLKR